MSRKHTTKSTESDFRFLERDACIELKIPDHLHGAVVELAARGKNLVRDVTLLVTEASLIYGHGAEEGSGEAAGSLGGSE